MRSFISFQPGETRGCVGCHESQGRRPDAEAGAVGPAARAVDSRAAALGRPAAELPPRHSADLRPALRDLSRRAEAGGGPGLLRRADDRDPLQDPVRRRTGAGRPQYGLSHADHQGSGRLQPQVRSAQRTVAAAGVRLASEQADCGTPRGPLRQTRHAEPRGLAEAGHLGRRQRPVPQPLHQHAARTAAVQPAGRSRVARRDRSRPRTAMRVLPSGRRK